MQAEIPIRSRYIKKKYINELKRFQQKEKYIGINICNKNQKQSKVQGKD